MTKLLKSDNNIDETQEVNPRKELPERASEWSLSSLQVCKLWVGSLASLCVRAYMM